MKHVFVTGGTGFVGIPVCTQLARQGWQVTVPTRHAASAGPLLHLPQLRVLDLDVHDEDALLRAVAGHKAVVNLVGILHGTAAEFERVHVALPQKLAHACLVTGVRRVVHISALGADAQHPADAPSLYLRSKGQGELVWRQAAGEGAHAAFELTILRPSVMFGAGDKFLNLFAKLQKVLPVLLLAGAATRFQPVWVEDVASAVVRSLARGETAPGPSPQVLELCGPQVFTLKELVQLAGQLSGVRGGRGRPVMALPDGLGRLQARLMELAPGAPLLSRDNLDSMKIDNVASGTLPGLSSLGIVPSALRPIAQDYLMQNPAGRGV